MKNETLVLCILTYLFPLTNFFANTNIVTFSALTSLYRH